MLEKIRRFESQPLQKMRFVCQTGGNNPKVNWEATGPEGIVFGSVMFGGLKLTAKGVIHVFDEATRKWLGFIKRGSSGLPEKYKANEELKFEDFYTRGE